MQEAMTAIKEHRYDVRKTARDVAKESGISANVYSRLEKGKQKISVEYAVKLSKVMGVPWNILIEESYPELFRKEEQ